MAAERKWWIVIGGSQLLTLVLVAAMWLRPAGPRPALTYAQAREHAAELRRRELWEPAVAAYRRLLDSYPDARDQAGSIHLILGDLLDQNLYRPEQALADYLLAEQLADRASLRSDARQKVVAVLERLGRNLEAASAASSYSRADAGAGGAAADVVAEVGATRLTRAEFERELRRLPPQAQQQLLDNPQAKAELLRTWVARELLYQSGLRRGLDRDPEVQAELEELRRGLISERAIASELGAQPQPSAQEVELYYQAHADRYRRDPKDANSVAPLSEVGHRVAHDLAQERQEQAVRELLRRLLEAAGAKLYPERL